MIYELLYNFSDVESDAAKTIWGDLKVSLEATFRLRIPGFIGLILKQLLPGMEFITNAFAMV